MIREGFCMKICLYGWLRVLFAGIAVREGLRFRSYLEHMYLYVYKHIAAVITD
jgi:hypothetical protein